jgi:hypothetical protein
MNAAAETIRFTATDVTGTHTVEATDVQRTLPAGAVARSIADKFGLPGDVPWALRSDSTSAYLDEDVAIGDQIESDSRITIFPRTHLGGRVR